jgi:hypothetical protein
MPGRRECLPRADGAAVYPSPQMALRDMGPADWATDTVTGAEAHKHSAA